MEENWTLIEQTSLKVETYTESKMTHARGTHVQLLAQAESSKQAVCSDDVFPSITSFRTDFQTLQNMMCCVNQNTLVPQCYYCGLDREANDDSRTVAMCRSHTAGEGEKGRVCSTVRNVRAHIWIATWPGHLWTY